MVKAENAQLQSSPEVHRQQSFGLGADNPALPAALDQSRSGLEGDVSRGDVPGSISQLASFPKDWSRSRRCIATVMSSGFFDMFIGIVVLVNIGLIVHQTNQSGLGMEPDFAIEAANVIFLILYTLEGLLRLYAFRLDFWRSYWNLLDTFILSADWTLQIINWTAADIQTSDVFKALRVIRALRVLRSIRTLHLFRELYIMLYGFLNALKAIGWAAVLLLLMLLILGIMAVEMVHPLAQILHERGVYGDCERCHRAFQTVWMAALTFWQQIVAGDSWGRITIPIMEEYPLTAPYFAMVFITIDLGLLNLILSVIVDKAHQAQQEDVKFQLTQRQAAFEGAKRSLLYLCELLDEDKSGSLSFEELLEGYDNLPEFQEQMRLMDVEREDMQSLFRVLDEDGSGDIQYSEFVEQVVKMRSQDTTLSLLFLRSQMKDMKHVVGNLEEKVDKVRYELKKAVAVGGTSVRMTDSQSSVMSFAKSAATQTEQVDTTGKAEAAVYLPFSGDSAALHAHIRSLRETASYLERMAQGQNANAGHVETALSVEAAMPIVRGPSQNTDGNQFSLAQRCCSPPPRHRPEKLVEPRAKHSRV